MKHKFLSRCSFYTLRNSNLLINLNHLYTNSINRIKITEDFDYDTIDSVEQLKTNFLVISWGRYLIGDYVEDETKPDFEKDGFIFTKKFFDIIVKLAEKGFHFLIDNTMEADTYVTPEMVLFFEKFKHLGIPEDRITMIYNNSWDIEGGDVKIRDFKIKTLHYPYFFVATLFDLPEPTNKDFKKEKEFLILNRRVGSDKLNLLKKLLDRDLLKESIYTALLPQIDVINDNFFYKEKKEISDAIGIGDMSRVSLKEDVASVEDVIKDDTYLYKINTDVFYKTKVNIVAETIMKYKYSDYYEDMIHITEKTWKPIYLGVPFVVCGSNKHIEALHKFGFKTFGNIINEDYDNELDIDVKMEKVIDSAIELAKRYNDKEVLEITEFNSNLYKNVNHHRDIVERFFLKPFENRFKKESKFF